MSTKHRSWHLIVFVCCVFFLFAACKQALTPTQAEKHLRAFDSEMMSLARKLSGTTSYEVLNQLFQIRNAPVPFKYNRELGIESLQSYSFNQHKGVYLYQTENNGVYKYADSDSVIIIFPVKTNRDSLTRFVIASYSEQLSIWGSMLPVKAEMYIEVGNNRPFTLNLDGKLQHKAPIDFNMHIKWENIDAEFKLKTKLSHKKSRVKTNLVINKNQTAFIEASTNSLVKVTPENTFQFDQTCFNAKVFPITLKGKVEYEKIRFDKHSFIDEFNKNSHIKVFSNKNECIGVIELKDRPSCDQVNLVIEYNDGTFHYLDDLLFSVRAIMNVKI
jgi:hypothetical protein